MDPRLTLCRLSSARVRLDELRKGPRKVIANRRTGNDAASPDDSRPDSPAAAEVTGSWLLPDDPAGDCRTIGASPGPCRPGWSRIPPSCLRHSDEQTVAGRRRRSSAICGQLGDRSPESSSTRWGILVAPPVSWAGPASCTALDRFRGGGGLGRLAASDPSLALHSPAGTLSLALGMHGPNLGIGGGLRRGVRGLPDGPDLAGRGRGARPLAGPERLVAGVRAGPPGRAACGVPVSGAGPGAGALRRPMTIQAGAAAGRLAGRPGAAVLAIGESEAFSSRPRTTVPGRSDLFAGTDVRAGSPDRSTSIRTSAGTPARDRSPGRSAATPRDECGSSWSAAPASRQGGRLMEIEEPVWITGVGLATPLGCDLATLEANLLAGKSGIAAVTSFPDRRTIPAGSRPPSTESPARRARTRPRSPSLPRLEQAALWCVESALRDAGLVGPSSRRSTRAGAGHRCRVDAALGGRPPARGQPRGRPGAGRRIDPRSRAPRLRAQRAGVSLSAACASRQLRAGDGPDLAAAGAGGRLHGRGLRHGGHAHRPGDVRQPAGPVAAERRPGRGLAAVRPRSRRLRAGRGGRGLRAGARRRRPAALGPRLRGGRRLRVQQRRASTT